MYYLYCLCFDLKKMILPKHSVNCDCPLNKKKLLYSLFLLELSTPKVVVTQLCKHNRFHLISCARKKIQP